MDALDRALLVHSSLNFLRRSKYWDGFLDLVDRTQVQRGFGDFSAYLWVAEGQGEIALSTTVKAWDVAAIKAVAGRLQTQVVDRAIQIFGAMGLSPDTPLAWLWTWGRALRLMDGPDEVHLRTVARHELAQARERVGASAAYFTTPAQLDAPVRIR